MFIHQCGYGVEESLRMRFENIYFINGTAYAGKSTMVKMYHSYVMGIDESIYTLE